MWTKSKSVVLSSVLVKVVFVAMIAALFFVPKFVHWYDKSLVGQPLFIWICAFMYAMMTVGFFALFTLNTLLTNIKRGDVFIHRNVTCLRVLAYYCLAAGGLFFAIGFYRPTLFIVAFAAVFLSLILRVVKNVFEAAVALREENDTVI